MGTNNRCSTDLVFHGLLAYLLKFILIIRCQSNCDNVEDHRGWLIMAISGRSEASLRNYIGRSLSEKIRVCSDILSDALRGRPNKSL